MSWFILHACFQGTRWRLPLHEISNPSSVDVAEKSIFLKLFSFIAISQVVYSLTHAHARMRKKHVSVSKVFLYYFYIISILFRQVIFLMSPMMSPMMSLRFLTFPCVKDALYYRCPLSCPYEVPCNALLIIDVPYGVPMMYHRISVYHGCHYYRCPLLRPTSNPPYYRCP